VDVIATMSDLDQQVAALQQRVREHQRSQLESEARRNQAQGALQAAQAALAAEFPGITTHADGQALLAQLDVTVAAEVSRVTTALEAAGG
jgi:hypothetical protein